jgi:hypothetical protein
MNRWSTTTYSLRIHGKVSSILEASSELGSCSLLDSCTPVSTSSEADDLCQPRYQPVCSNTFTTLLTTSDATLKPVFLVPIEVCFAGEVKCLQPSSLTRWAAPAQLALVCMAPRLPGWCMRWCRAALRKERCHLLTCCPLAWHAHTSHPTP